jgi:hypothetical protein
VTLQLPDDSPVLDQPWIITFGPLGDADEWEPVVCGPYERAHALGLAEAVVADEPLMAVVEPLFTAVTVDEIRGEISAAMTTAEDQAVQTEEADLYGDYEDTVVDQEGELVIEEPPRRTAPPSEREIRAGIGRIAERLAARSR